MPQLRVLVADDSLSFRSILVDSLKKLPTARIVALASNGQEAVDKFAEFNPDVLTLDVEMPVLDGFQVLEKLRPRLGSAVVIMVSAMTHRSAGATIRALELGAFSFITKPEESSPDKNREVLRQQLSAVFDAIVAKRIPAGTVTTPPVAAPVERRPAAQPKIIGIGASTGGPHALAEILPRLPGNLSVPVVLVQHMPPLFTASLAEAMAAKCAVKVVEAEHGMSLQAGTVYIAPGGRHMRIVDDVASASKRVELTSDAPEHYCRPAVDYLFRSLATTYRANAAGVILTGMGQDGAQGLLAMRQAGATTIGQDAATCTVYGMPREAHQIGAVEVQLPLERIAERIAKLAS
jgi:two-component system, chemotaxis family, protein-glutamate methylesterase/glutaminase